MKISVVIPLFNGARTLPDCLQALARQTHPDYEVLFVDNNSTDGSPEIVTDYVRQHPGFPGQLHREGRQGACLARNTGVRAATGAVVANIDPDCLPTPGWLSDLARLFARRDVAMVAGGITSRPPESLAETFSALFTLSSVPTERTHSAYTLLAGGFPTANLAIRREWFDRVGGFDERLNHGGVGIGEDHDLCARVYAAGGRLLATPEAAVCHWHRSSFRQVFRQGFLFGLAQALLTRRYGGRRVRLCLGGLQLRLPFPLSGWIDLNLLATRVLLLLALGLLHWALVALPIAYLLLFAAGCRRRSRDKAIPMSAAEALCMPGYMLAKSAGMLIGRLRGSFQFGCVCV